MGAFETGWNWGERRIQERDARKDEQRQAELANITNAGLTPEQQAEAIRTLYANDPSALKRHVRNLFGRMVGKQPQPTPDAYPAKSATVTGAPLQVGGGEVSVTPPAGENPDEQAPAVTGLAPRETIPAPPPTTVRQPAARTQGERRAQILSGGTTKQQRALESASVRQRQHPILKEYVSPDGKQRQWFDAAQPENIPKGWQATAGISGVPRVLPPLSMSAAKTMAGMGIQFTGVDGQPIDPNQFDDALQLVPVIQGDKTTYRVTSQGQTHLTVGNEVYAVPRLNQTDLPTKGTQLGPAKTGSTSQREAIAVGPSGEPIKQTLTSTTTPNTPGVRGESRLPAPPVGAGAAPPRSTGTPTAVPPRTGAAAAGPSGAKPAYMTPSMYNQQIQVARPVRVAANQIFGDPTQPDFMSLSDYGDLMNNPDSVQRMGAVARLMIDELAAAEPSKTGGFWTLLTTSGGLPQALAGAQASATLDALNSLPPREQELLDAEMDAYGAIIGLRAITKGSSARFSAKSLEREVPLPGFSASNAFQFYDKLSRLGEEVWSGSKGLSEQVLPEKSYYQKQYDKLLALKEQSRPKAPAPKGTTPKTAEEYLQSHQ